MPILLTINERKVQAEPGMTVLEAALANGIYIPTLCYAPKLPPFGGCRMCIVQIEKMPGLPTACTVPVAEGMVVHTDTPVVQEQRRETLALLLSEHPYTCITCGGKCADWQGTIRKAEVTTGCQYCPKNGQCELQKVAEHVCLQEVPYPISYRMLSVEHDDPFFDRDMNLCIVCGRCVRTCNDIRHAGVLALIDRGDRTYVGTASGRSLIEAGCQFCGACVDACPTGALFDKRSKWEGVPERIVSSICPYCSVGCAVNVQVRKGRVLRLVGNDDGPANDGEICVRGRFGVVDIVHNVARVKTPLIKRGQRQVQAAWDAAMAAVAEGLMPYRGDQFAVVASATATNEELFMLQKFAREVMKSNNIAVATNAPAPTAPAVQGSASIRSLRDARTILVIGCNPCESHPIVGLEIRHALSKGANLIILDPRRTPLTQKATVWLQAKPGTDAVLLTALVEVKESGDRDVSLRSVTARTGVCATAVRSAAHLLDQKPAMVVYGSGVTHQEQAEETVAAIGRLADMLGAGVIGLAGEGNIVGAYDMGCHHAFLPGYRLSNLPGRDYRSIIDGIRRSEVKALYLAGDVPPLPEWQQAAFLVVQGIVHSQVSKLAHVVLPATTFVEMDGTMTNLEGRIQRLRQAIEPVGEARPGWQIMRDIACRMGAEWSAESTADVQAEIAVVVPAYAAMEGVRHFPSRPEPLPRIVMRRLSRRGFPMVLIAERNCYAYGGVSLMREVKGLAQIRQENILYLSREDAQAMGISDGGHAKVTSPYGSIYWPVRVSADQRRGVAWVSVNPVDGAPVFPDWTPDGKALPVRIEASD